jgi:membrane protein implicated in regulation of membrane protease activity
MPGWGWLVIGALLFATEMFLIDAQFYLVFLGAAAVVVGLFEWSGLPLSQAAQWLLFAFLAVVAMAGFRKRLYRRLRRQVDTVPEAVTAGDRVQLPEVLAPGQSCRVEYRGSTWTARNTGVTALSGEVVIIKVDGLTLLVQANAS